MRISINQPYFLPYAGWFRLLTTADVFVVYDDVQFPYPGYVHRNQLIRTDGQIDWLGLPIKRKPLGYKINEMEWLDNSDELWIRNSRRFRAYSQPPNNYLRFITYYLQTANRRMDIELKDPLEFIVQSIRAANYELGIGKGSWRESNRGTMVYSSSLNIPSELRGQDRVLWICEKMKAKEYINAPGGRDLYSREDFKKRGVELKFLCDFPNKTSILDRLMTEKPQDVRKEIDDYSLFQ